MLLFRSLSLGLMAACFLLQLDRVQHVQPPPPPPAPPPISVAQAEAPPTIIDVAGGVRPGQLSSLVRLQRGERVTAVDDRMVGSDLEAGAAITEHVGGYIDLTVQGATATRRVLMLLH